jgi:acyl dehydratase
VSTLAERVGFRSDTYRETIDAERAMAFARATNDERLLAGLGRTVPPVFAAVLCTDPTGDVIRAVLPETAWTRMIHFAQDLHLHLPLRPGESVTSAAEAHSVRAISLGTLLCVRSTLTDEHGRLLVEMYSTLLVLGLAAGGSAGPTPPDHRAPRGGAEPHRATRHVDLDQTYRYSDASGDHMPVHLDPEAARSMGMPGIILHGMCGLAMAGTAVVDTVGGTDLVRLRRLAVRFLRPVLPGQDLDVTMRRSVPEEPVWSFTVRSAGRVVMNDGLAVLDDTAEVPTATAGAELRVLDA